MYDEVTSLVKRREKKKRIQGKRDQSKSVWPLETIKKTLYRIDTCFSLSFVEILLFPYIYSLSLQHGSSTKDDRNHNHSESIGVSTGHGESGTSTGLVGLFWGFGTIGLCWSIIIINCGWVGVGSRWLIVIKGDIVVTVLAGLCRLLGGRGGSGFRFGFVGAGWVGGTADLVGFAALGAVRGTSSAVLDAVFDLVGAEEVWDGLRVFSGVWDGVIGTNALPLEGLCITLVGEATSRLLVKAEEGASGDLMSAPNGLGSHVEVVNIDGPVYRGGRSDAQEGGRGGGELGEEHLV